MGEVFNRSININYSLSDFDENPKEKEAITAAKQKALQMKFSINEITEIGSGSKGRTTVYKTDQGARKVICCQTQKYTGKDLKKEEKTFLQKVKNDLSFRKSIVNEIQCWMKLNRKNNIIPMYGFEIFSWTCPEYNRIGADCEVEMPLAECITNSIDKYVLRKQKANFEEKSEDEGLILQVGIDLCTALTAVHKENIIHRDIKPDNIFLLDEHFCLGDFGIALDQNNPQYLSADSSMNQVGTYAYWAPEQADGKIADQRTDIYSLGLVLYELADTAPMSSHYKDRIYEHILPELSADISKGLKSILRNACAYSPDHRYQTAEEFKDDLCRLKDNPEYIPESTKYKFEQKIDQTKMSHILEMGRVSNGKLSESSRFHKFRINNQRSFEKYLCPETAWKAGKFWYDESCKSGSRFAGLDIDKWIMPLTSPKPHITDFPVNITTNPECNSKPIPLFKIIEQPENLHNMYLIGEGGIGKTTALHFIMKDAYKDKVFTSTQNKTLVIPLFVELSKAPASYCNAYKNNQSTFIQRYLFTLISSLSENHLIFENAYEMTTAMEMEADSIIKNIRYLLDNKNQTVKYLLLLDGLNEVSRRELIDDYNNQIGTPSDLIIDEIQELLKYSNVSAIITSRADETLGVLDNEFNRLYLTGVSEQDIERYLERYEIDYTTIKENNCLMETLKIPLFLKLYSQLYSVSGVSTPGEILYAFFSERSVEYTARKRITEIGKDRRTSGNTHSASFSDIRMQWFILDFLLPELGWYMEKNDLYIVDRAIIQNVMDSVLKGTSETDICGKYGIEMFDDYHNGNDGSINAKTYADQLLSLKSTNYIQEIVDFCVYSLGILYVNNQNYGFIHQHLRDFFAAIKNINTLKMSLFVDAIDINAGYRCLSQFNSDMIHSNVSGFIGEILSEYKEKSVHEYSLLEKCIDLYRRKYTPSDNVKYGLYNLLKIIYEARNSLTSLNLSYLDLSSCHFNGINLENSILDHSVIGHDNLFRFGHTGPVVKAVFSNTGKYIYSASYDGTVKLWHASNLKYVKTVIKLENTSIENIALSNNNEFLLVSTPKYSILYETKTYTQLYEYKDVFTGIFDNDNHYLALAYYTQPIQLVDLKSFKVIQDLGYLFKGRLNGDKRKNILLFSPDSKYMVFVNTEMNIEIWDMESLQLMGYYEISKEISSIAFDSQSKQLGIAYYASSDEKSFDIVDFNSILQNLKFKEKKSFAKHLSDVFEQKYQYSSIIKLGPCTDTLAVGFVSNDKYFLTADSDGNLQLHNLSDNNTKYVLQGCCSHVVSYISEYKILHDDYIVTGGNDGTIKIWNLKTMQCADIIPNGFSGRITNVKFSPDGKFIVIASNDVTVWNAKQGTFGSMLADKGVIATSIAFSTSGQFLAVGFENGLLILYKYENGEFTSIFEEKVFDGMINNLQFKKNENSVLISETNSVIKILNISSQKLVTIQCDANIAWHGVFSPRDNSILYCDCQSVENLLFNEQDYSALKTGSYRQLNKTDNCLSAYAAKYIACSPDCKYIAFGWQGGQIEIRLSEDLNSCVTVIYTGTYEIQSITFSTDSKYMAIISRRNGMKIYETQNWNCIRNIHGYKGKKLPQTLSDMYKTGHIDYINCIDCYNDNQTFLSGSNDGTVKLWKPFLKEHKNSTAIRHSKLRNILKKLVVTVYSLINQEKMPVNILAEYSLDIDKAFLEVYKCEYTIYYISGLRVKNTSIRNLHPSSNLSKEHYMLLKIYGAKTSEDI